MNRIDRDSQVRTLLKCYLFQLGGRNPSGSRKLTMLLMTKEELCGHELGLGGLPVLAFSIDTSR